jgi:hypothetical protein
MKLRGGAGDEIFLGRSASKDGLREAVPAGFSGTAGMKRSRYGKFKQVR